MKKEEESKESGRDTGKKKEQESDSAFIGKNNNREGTRNRRPVCR